jgi:hypothetical protein
MFAKNGLIIYICLQILAQQLKYRFEAHYFLIVYK